MSRYRDRMDDVFDSWASQWEPFAMSPFSDLRDRMFEELDSIAERTPKVLFHIPHLPMRLLHPHFSSPITMLTSRSLFASPPLYHSTHFTYRHGIPVRK